MSWWHAIFETPWSERCRALELACPRIERPGDGLASNWGYQLDAGYLLDWIDAYPEDREQHEEALRELAAVSRNPVKAIAGFVGWRMYETGHFLECHAGGRDGPGYGVDFHAHVMGFMKDPVMDEAAAAYERLLAVEPECLSALANLAEGAWRRGDRARACSLLERGLARSRRSSDARHGIPDRAWEAIFACRLAELGAAPADVSRDAAELLALATSDGIDGLVERLRAYPSWAEAALPAHAAFGRASREQRVWLCVAFRKAPVDPAPLPSHAGLDELEEAQERIAGPRG